MAKIDLSSIKKTNNPTPIIQKKPVQPAQTKQAQARQPRQPAQPRPPRQPREPKEKPEKLDDWKRTSIVRKLQQYQQVFPDELGKMATVNVVKCSDKDLLEYEKIFESALNTNGAEGDMAVAMSKTALMGYEKLGCMVGLNIEGIAKMGNDPQWEKCIRILAIKYQDHMVPTMSVESQLGLMLLKNTAALHMFGNDNKPAIQSAPQPQIQPQQQQQQNIQPPVSNKSELQIKLELQDINSKFNDL